MLAPYALPTEHLDPVANEVQWLPQVNDSYVVPSCALGNAIKLLPPVDTSQEFPVLVDPGLLEDPGRSSTSACQKTDDLAGSDSEISPSSSSQKRSGTDLDISLAKIKKMKLVHDKLIWKVSSQRKNVCSLKRKLRKVSEVLNDLQKMCPDDNLD